MENYLKKVEQQVTAWEVEFEALLKEEIAKEPKWEEKRQALQVKIADTRERRGQRIEIVRSGIDAALEDLRVTYEELKATRQHKH